MVNERQAQALELRRQGYNCTQCVCMVFDPSLEVISGGLGRGVAGTGHICGAALAMALVTSQREYTNPKEKQALFARIREQIDRFAALNCGDTDCRDLRKPGRKPCEQLILDAITILDEN